MFVTVPLIAVWIALWLARPALAMLIGTGGWFDGYAGFARVWVGFAPVGPPLNHALLAKAPPGLSFAQTKLFDSQLSRDTSRRRRWPSMVLVKLTGARYASRLVRDRK